MTAMSMRQDEASEPPPLPLRARNDVEPAAVGGRPSGTLWRLGDGAPSIPCSTIRPLRSGMRGRRSSPFSAAPFGHLQVRTPSWHGDVTPRSNTFFEAEGMRTGTSRSQEALSCHLSQRVFIPGINPSSSFFTDTDALVHAILGIRPPAVKTLASTDSQDRMDKRNEASIAVRS